MFHAAPKVDGRRPRSKAKFAGEGSNCQGRSSFTTRSASCRPLPAGSNGGSTPRLHEKFGYAYDAAWNLNYRTNNALVETFSANAGNELTGASRSGTLTVAGTVGYGLSSVSVTVSGTGLSSGPAQVYGDGTWARAGASLSSGQNSYTATATDSYGRTAQDTVTVNLPAPVSFTYDANGNLTSDGLRTFEYDFDNQLTNVYVTGQWRSAFVYDALGRRRIRSEYTSSGGAWVKTNEVRYVYDGPLVIQERDANNLPNVAYTRGIDLSATLDDAGGIGGLLARTDQSLLTSQPSSAHAYYHCDGNGNVTCLINSNNAVVARYNYDPFGNVLAMSGPLADANLYRFSSKEYHANSRLVYYLYRFYDPNLQRWTKRDPIGEAAGPNLQQFVGNKPLDFIDPYGFACDKTKLVTCLLDLGINTGLGRIPVLGCFLPDINPAQCIAGTTDKLCDLSPLGAGSNAAGAGEDYCQAQYNAGGGDQFIQRQEHLATRHATGAKPGKLKQVSQLKKIKRAARILGPVSTLLELSDIYRGVKDCLEKSGCAGGT